MGCATQKKDVITGDVVLHYVLHKDDDLVGLVERELAEFRSAFSEVCGPGGHFNRTVVKLVSFDRLPITGEARICTARYNSDEANYELNVMASRGYALRNDPFRKVDGIKLRFVVEAIG
jgi:hypothetical protein